MSHDGHMTHMQLLLLSQLLFQLLQFLLLLSSGCALLLQTKLSRTRRHQQMETMAT